MIQDSVNKVIYSGNGEATEFFYPFEITKNTDVKVMTVSPEGVETVLTNDYYVDTERSIVHYPGWVDGEELGKEHSFSPLADGWKLVIYREVDYTQDTSMFEQYPFNVIEKMIDKTTILAQQLKDETDRSMRLGIAVDNVDINMTIPHGQGTSFRWSDDGKRLETTDDPAKVKVTVANIANKVEDDRIKTAESAATVVAKATETSISASNAKTSETNAKTSEVNAKNSENNARASMDYAKKYMSNAGILASNAKTSETNAKESETNAKTSETNAKESETNAKTSEVNAKTSELNTQAFAEAVLGGGVLDVSKGGTGANTAEEALENLGGVSQKNGVVKETFSVDNGQMQLKITSSLDTNGFLIEMQGISDNANTSYSMFRLDEASFNLRAGGYENENRKYLGGNTDGDLWWGTNSIVVDHAHQYKNNGYVKFSNGLCLQWGSISNSGTEATVTYPIPFRQVFYVSPTVDWEEPQLISTVTKINTTNFRVFVTKTCLFYWFAIGEA